MIDHDIQRFLTDFGTDYVLVVPGWKDPWYVYRIKFNEDETRIEFEPLTKNPVEPDQLSLASEDFDTFNRRWHNGDWHVYLDPSKPWLLAIICRHATTEK